MSEASQSNKKAKAKIKSWYSNRYQFVTFQRNVLLLFTVVSMFSVAVAVIFVKQIMSSKSLDPYVIEVEEKTGIATVVNQLTAQNFTGDQAVRRYFINAFVHSANGYDPRTYKQDLDKVRLFSNPQVYSDFRNRINPKELGPEAFFEVRIKSIQFPDPNTAQIRTSRQVKLANTDPKMKDEVITMGFYFAPENNLTMEERLINPLGFQVNKYVIADEVFSY
jgi:type IV secretion system protein VirB8